MPRRHCSQLLLSGPHKISFNISRARRHALTSSTHNEIYTFWPLQRRFVQLPIVRSKNSLAPPSRSPHYSCTDDRTSLRQCCTRSIRYGAEGPLSRSVDRRPPRSGMYRHRRRADSRYHRAARLLRRRLLPSIPPPPPLRVPGSRGVSGVSGTSQSSGTAGSAAGP